MTKNPSIPSALSANGQRWKIIGQQNSILHTILHSAMFARAASRANLTCRRFIATQAGAHGMLRWSTWAWGVLGGEHQRKALLPKWQGPSWTQQQNCRVQRSNSIKSAVFPAVAGAQEHFEYRKGWYKSRSFGLRWWVLWNRPCWFGGHPVVKTPVTYSRAIFMDGLPNW